MTTNCLNPSHDHHTIALNILKIPDIFDHKKTQLHFILAFKQQILLINFSAGPHT